MILMHKNMWPRACDNSILYVFIFPQNTNYNTDIIKLLLIYTTNKLTISINPNLGKTAFIFLTFPICMEIIFT